MDPYVDPHAYDYRNDPTQRTNPKEFWEGYGKFREGKNYDEIPQTPAHIAGWSYGLAEGKRQESAKPLWQSKTFFEGLALIILSIWGGMNIETIKSNPEAVTAIGAVFGVVTMWLRKITKGPIV